MSSSKVIKDGASNSIIKFLIANVPKSDHVNIENELKKDFLLAKKKQKQKYQNKRRNKKLHIVTRKEKKDLGFYHIPRNSVRYNEVVPLYEIWSEYIIKLLDLDISRPEWASKGWDQFTQKLYKADFHGSMLNVVRSKCPGYIGVKGICVMDTKNTFKIVTLDNKVTTVPKKDSVFEIHAKCIKICVFGKHLCVRPADRSTKKVKTYLHPDL